VLFCCIFSYKATGINKNRQKNFLPVELVEEAFAMFETIGLGFKAGLSLNKISISEIAKKSR